MVHCSCQQIIQKVLTNNQNVLTNNQNQHIIAVIGEKYVPRFMIFNSPLENPPLSSFFYEKLEPKFALPQKPKQTDTTTNIIESILNL